MMSLPDFKYKQCIFYFSSKEKCVLKFRADNLVLEDQDKNVLLQHSCHRVFSLCIVGNITITSVIIKKSKQFGFPVLLLSRNFKLDAYLNNVAEGNFLLRKKQYILNDEQKLMIAKQLVSQKIHNQKQLLKSIRRKVILEKESIDKLGKIDVDIASCSKELLGIEGSASKVFFSTYFRKNDWIRREPRTKRDINNLLMDIGYTYLFNFVEAMISLYGFDLFCGVYHTFFYQRKSLVCDLVEPFRCIIDKSLRKAFSLKQIAEEDFYVQNGMVTLKYKNQGKYTSIFVKALLEYKEDIFLYIQAYYRWIMKDKDIKEFPVFYIQ
jgi:CRISP-associated protein Cas1